MRCCWLALVGDGWLVGTCVAATPATHPLQHPARRRTERICAVQCLVYFVILFFFTQPRAVVIRDVCKLSMFITMALFIDMPVCISLWIIQLGGRNAHMWLSLCIDKTDVWGGGARFCAAAALLADLRRASLLLLRIDYQYKTQLC